MNRNQKLIVEGFCLLGLVCGLLLAYGLWGGSEPLPSVVEPVVVVHHVPEVVTPAPRAERRPRAILGRVATEAWVTGGGDLEKARETIRPCAPNGVDCGAVFKKDGVIVPYSDLIGR